MNAAYHIGRSLSYSLAVLAIMIIGLAGVAVMLIRNPVRFILSFL
jgi:hypothetical protein